MWQPTPPTVPKPRSWKLTPPVAVPVAKPWKVKYTREFGLTVSPQIGMGAAPSPIFTGEFGLTLTPEIGMVAAGRSTAEFGLTLSPQIGVDAVVRVPGSFGLSLTPTLGFDAQLAPVEFDNATIGGSGGATTRSWSHTINGNCLVVVFTHTNNANPVCTVGGFNVPRVYGPAADGAVFPYTSRISIFAVVSDSLPQGAQTISCTEAGTASAAMAMSFRRAGSIGTVVSDTSSGNVNQTATPGAGGAAVAGYVGGSSNFGLMSPNSAGNFGFTAFVTWATVAGWGLDTGSGVPFSAAHSGAKTGAVVPILPAT